MPSLPRPCLYHGPLLAKVSQEHAPYDSKEEEIAHTQE
jgi:hypothetical protein